eukprot:TRINITY_DN19952_c0_g1_i1.p1 TRINITY_DN19952_c0_g1~~TRINITY_DN19952_c0_g1_i1.p1  ORF type:complete len:121 (+),score=18.32 TRINITY_DN19952_c0_g1_i1:157-519(+)
MLLLRTLGAAPGAARALRYCTVSQVSTAEVERISKMARLKGLPSAALTQDLQSIVAFFDDLKNVDVSHVEPLYTLQNDEHMMREDRALHDDGEGIYLLRGAARTEHQHFVVPKAVDSKLK